MHIYPALIFPKHSFLLLLEMLWNIHLYQKRFILDCL